VWRKLLIAWACTAFAWSASARDTSPATAGVTLSFTAGKELHRDSNARQARGLALVIGNSSYAGAPLRNPANDAQAMAFALRRAGFEVMHYGNLDRAGMEDALESFQARLAGGGTGLFYFAGHGFRVGDKTVLAPLDIDLAAPATLLRRGIELDSVLERMSPARPGGHNIVLLDTCLNNPFGGASAPLPPQPSATTVLHATTPGGFAAENGSNGAFTSALLAALQAASGDPVQALLGAAPRSGTLQPPVLAAAGAGGSRAILPKDSAEQYEITFWESIKDSKDVGDYEAYLQAYPKGRFAALAKSRIERLRAAAKPEAPAEAAKPAPPPKVSAPEKPRAPKPAPEQARPAPKEKTEPPPPVARPEQPAPKVARGAEVKDCEACPVLVSVTPGAFTMGSNSGDPSEKPAHQVSIGTPFAIGKYEVTVEQWNACVEGGGCPRIASAGAPGTPIRDVSWDDAQQYVKWLSSTSGKPYRLPTEAEWEYAARGGTTSRFWWGEQMKPGHANCKDCGEPWSQDGPAKAGSFAANPYGLHDVNGSVWEWVADCWHNSYKGAPSDSRAWDAAGCRERVIRGGSWRDGSGYMPSSTRFKYGASVRHSQNGFRVARDLK